MLKSHDLKYRVNDYVDSQFVKIELPDMEFSNSLILNPRRRSGRSNWTDLSLLLIIYTIDYKNVSSC